MSKKSLTFLTAILSLIAVMLFAIPFGGCAKEEELPVWQLSETVTAGFTDNGKYGYILTVEGTGEIPDYPSEKATYWAGKSGRVTDIVVSDGITSIGENAFAYCYYVKSVVLPASVKSVGKNAFPAGTKIYCYAAEVEAGEGMTVYTYSESKPTVGGNFWHDANGTPAVWPSVVTSPQKILFIGNSYTFYNDMPTLFENIATAAGAEVKVESVTTGSQSLKNWADPATDDGARVESKLTASSDYDIIVLQEKSTSPVNDDYRYFVSGAKALAKRIGETQDNCRIFLYETWGSPAYAGTYGGSIPAMESRLRTAYDTVAESIGANVSYVGKAFTYMYENYGGVNMYNTEDKNHPSYEGSYLAACVHATTLLGLDVTNVNYDGTLDAETAELLRMVGYSIAVGANIPEITYDMQIAVYSRYADASVIGNLVAAFKADYAAKNSVEAPAIKYSLLGAGNTNVATFGELVNAGNYDLILAAGNNINTSGGVTVIAKKSYRVVDSVYPTGDNRYVCRLTENELAVAFYDFMESDVAKTILDPDYVPEVVNEITLNFVVDGEPYGTPVVLSSASSAGAKALPELPEKANLNPMGWALTADEEENETLYNGNVTYSAFADVAQDGAVTLYARYVSDDTTVITVNIAVFKRYVNENTIISLISAFKESYTVNDGEVLNVTYELLGDSSTKAEEFGNLVKAGNFNITFASGTNVSDYVTVIDQNDKVFVAYYGNNRTVAYLTEDDATKAFFEFLDTDVAKKILNPAYVSDSEAKEITVNLIVSGSAYGEAIVVSNATSATAKSLPKPEALSGSVFKGWATAEQEQESEELIPAGTIAYDKAAELATGETLTLYARFATDEGPESVTITIGYYSSGKNTVSDEQIAAIETAFKAYALEEGYAVEMTFKAYSGMTDMNGDAANKLFDYSLNTGNAITEANGVSGTKVQPEGSSRYVMQIADNEISALFHQFALQDETIKGF